MAFFDKLKDKTSDMVEITKLNLKINEEKNKIIANKSKLAEYYWSKYESGTQLDPVATDICTLIKVSNDAIASLNQEITNIKTATPEPAPTQPQTPKTIHCASCGEAITPGQKFCSSCGAPAN